MIKKKLVVYKNPNYEKVFVIKKAINTMYYPIGSKIKLADLQHLIDTGEFTVDLISNKGGK